MYVLSAMNCLVWCLWIGIFTQVGGFEYRGELVVPVAAGQEGNLRYNTREYSGAPIFSRERYEAKIFDKAERGSNVTRVRAASADGSDVFYSFTRGGDKHEMFLINSRTGLITLAETDAFQKDSYQFQVKAKTSSESFSTCVVVVDIIAMNKYKPEFLECQEYHPSVEEEKKIGTFVIKVKATDYDTGQNAKVTYSIVTPPNIKEELFRIDSGTGSVTTNKMFDRDEPSSEKLFHLTVKAIDGGENPLESVCTFPITITDINDNAPIFDSSEYNLKLDKNTKAGDRVARVRATDLDADANGLVKYSFDGGIDPYLEFEQDSPGLIVLKNMWEEQRRTWRIKAEDSGTPSRSTFVDLTFSFNPSDIGPPIWISKPEPPIMFLYENFTVGSTLPAKFEASPGKNANSVTYRIVNGNSASTNKDSTFQMIRDEAIAKVILTKHLDYEAITQYDLQIQAENNAGLVSEAPLTIKVEDVNDMFPIFSEVKHGQVIEEEVNIPVLTVLAIDEDGTSPNNEVTYSLDVSIPESAFFSIERKSGEIRTAKALDFEDPALQAVHHTYRLVVIAEDGAPSALQSLQPQHNKATLDVYVEVRDANDNPPKFNKTEYYVSARENEDVGKIVAQIEAFDIDTESRLIYKIEDGNDEDKFRVEPLTGEIIVNGILDYERTKEYVLTLGVSDSLFQSSTKVFISIENICDTPPEFVNTHIYKEIYEIRDDSELPQLLVTVPVKEGDDDACDKILYFFDPGEKRFDVDQSGNIRIVEVLDREEVEKITLRVYATYFAANGVQNHAVINITLLDINDNAPELTRNSPVVFYENQDPAVYEQGLILEIQDRDTPENGPPFYCSLGDDTDPLIRERFEIIQTHLGDETEYKIRPIVTLDREEIKKYFIPLKLRDSGEPVMVGTSTLTVIVGDMNDNPMTDGRSEIMVYNYKGSMPETEIGRVFVEDLDDWDVVDKTFQCGPDSIVFKFGVDRDSGMITIKEGTAEGVYGLTCQVEDHNRGETAVGEVTVYVKNLPEAAVQKSGSVRLAEVTPEEFLSKKSLQDVNMAENLKRTVAGIHELFPEDIHIVSLEEGHTSEGAPSTDVRYGLLYPPLFEPMKYDGLLMTHIDKLPSKLKSMVDEVGINACLEEGKGECPGACSSVLKIRNTMTTTMSNRSSLVTVGTDVVPICECLSSRKPQGCSDDVCFNGGTCISLGFKDFECECPPGFTGPRCEMTQAHFSGDNLAWFRSLDTCQEMTISLTFSTQISSGTLVHFGSLSPTHRLRDFFRLELNNDGLGVVTNFGGDETPLFATKQFNDGQFHDVTVFWNQSHLFLRFDDVDRFTYIKGSHEYLNGNGPLQLGGVISGYSAEGANFFQGCIQNVTVNSQTLDMSRAAYSKTPIHDCSLMRADAIILRTNAGFAIAITSCILILLMLFLLLFYLRRRQRHKTEGTDEIRDTIINYDDEEGEKDTSNYNINILKVSPDGRPMPIRQSYQTREPRLPLPVDHGLKDYLVERKMEADDQVKYPDDDVRLYAYEGSGSLAGSLSSLNSDSDDPTQDFDYLPHYGPKFSKLADMYGGPYSDEDTDS